MGYLNLLSSLKLPQYKTKFFPIEQSKNKINFLTEKD